MIEFFFNLIVKPLQMLFEFLFSNVYNITDNIILSIFILSFIVSVLCLPLYLKADELQEEENKIQAKLAPRVKSIKENFKGDEQQLLLQTYYKQNNYHPIMGLRLSLSLLLQVPIFMAAYSYFSSLGLLEGLSAGIVGNLASPDGLLQIQNYKINIFPILMTIVNLLAGFVYSDSKSFSQNKVLVIVSLVFLVLLYNSPSALVIYWLFNNLFSLIKNICLLKISRENLIRYSLAVLFILYCVIAENYILPIVVVGIYFANLFFGKYFKSIDFDFDYKSLFLLGITTCWVILGLLIPSNVISTSSLEFLFSDTTPFGILSSTATIFAGAIIFWGLWLFYFASQLQQKLLSIGVCIFLVYALCNLFILKIPLTILLTTMSFETLSMDFNVYSTAQVILYTSVISISIIFILREIFKKQSVCLINKFILIVLISTFVLSVYNYSKIASVVFSHKTNEKALQEQNKNYIELSKTHKNVLILFVDRAIGAYIPLIFNEHPILKDQYKGFTYYPNTLSFAGYTLLGYPAILGGYEYTPMQMDKSDKLFEEEFRESLTVLPLIFKQNQWKSTVINPVGGEWESVMNDGVTKDDIDNLGNVGLYENSNINHYRIPKSVISHLVQDEGIEVESSSLTKRNLVYFTILSVLPPSARYYVYDYGNYHNIDNISTKNRPIYSEFFLKNYAELLYLDKLTTFTEKKNTFTVFNNALPHFHMFLRYPEYDLSSQNQEDYEPPVADVGWTRESYNTNVATLKLIGQYLSFLKKNNVYDNTRIIIVADHGFRSIELPAPLNSKFQEENITPYNPLLLVKDFGSNKEFSQVDEFMTNADVPMLATADIFEHPKNPYTNKEMNNNSKKDGVVIVQGNKWLPSFYLGKKQIFDNDTTFNYVKEDPRNPKNWKTNLNYDKIKKYY